VKLTVSSDGSVLELRARPSAETLNMRVAGLSELVDAIEIEVGPVREVLPRLRPYERRVLLFGLSPGAARRVAVRLARPYGRGRRLRSQVGLRRGCTRSPSERGPPSRCARGFARAWTVVA
jgi:hypothetical protein